jgi:hypothetical protein
MKLRSVHRTAILGLFSAIAVIAGTVAYSSRAASTKRERAIMRDARVDLAFADSLERALSQRTPNRISESEAVAALYFERLRLGLGSPFRLIDQALRDSTLSPVGSEAIGEALLARVMVGDAYRAREAAMDLMNLGGNRLLAAAHQKLIDSVVSSSADPRVGELSVRLAYRLASASGVVSRRAPEIATAAAAQSRDRIIAMRDARDLMTEAERDGVSRLQLMRVWRSSRRFEVERPVIVPLTARQERDAVADLPALVARINGIRDIQPDSTGHDSTANPSRRGDGLSSRMASVAAGRDLPPLAPVMVAVRSYSALLRSGDAFTDRVSKLRFIQRASNEETLAAEYALLMSRSAQPVPEADAAVLTASVGLRPFAQERAWLNGDAAPTARELQSRYGVTVTYDASTRSAWRPYFQRTLETAITDMRRVLPGFDSRGLTVHFGTSPLGDRALALHDPIRRVIYFPPTSHSGVMAHEFAHDLDWQAARREYGGTGWYRTDHALRQPVDLLAGAVLQMASASRDSSVGRMTGHARPTEVLARNVDWFVSASLAREGRVNGHLSAAQDPVLTGYASAITPEAARAGGSATLRTLDGITTIPAATRSWFSDLYGTDRRMTVHEAVRRVLEAPIGRLSVDSRSIHTQWLPGDRGFALSARPSWSCLAAEFVGGSDDANTVRAVIQYAAESRARGVILQWADFARRRPDASPSRLRALNGAPWDPSIAQQMLQEIRDAILLSAIGASDEVGALVPGPFRLPRPC